jgi:WD40 repeat protein
MPIPPRIEGFRSSLAVLIGIDRYGDNVPALRTPVADAEELAGVLRRDHGFEAEVVADEDATLSKLRALLADLGNRVGKDDRVLFYFAGHGIALESDEGPKGYLLPQDAGRDSIDQYLSMVELHEALSALPCRHMLVILDCCFAGAFRWSSTRELAIAPENLHRERYDWFVRDAAWQAIASAAHDQKALDVAAGEALGERGQTGGHSPFAKALIAGLAGSADRQRASGTGDGVITATELFLYLEEQLMPPLGSGRPRQTPLLWPLAKHDKGQFVFLVPGKELNLDSAPPLNPNTNPWRGLKPYESTDADVFFGRRRASERLLERVLHDPLVVVTGPSGIGKSSLVRAGLLPRLPASVHPIVVRPGSDPFASLAAELTSKAWSGGSPDAESLRTNANALAAWAKDQYSAGREILLVIDQAEELVTQTGDPGMMKSFLELVEHSLRQANLDVERRPFRVVITVRSEFEPQFAQSLLKDRWLGTRYLVPQMTQDELRRVIEGPAAVKVMRFESAELVDQLVNEVVQMPGALPLLSFALSEMYATYLRRPADDRTLTRKHYEALEGGVTGSLRVRANQIIDSMDDLHRLTARRVLERLVSLESGEFARRRVPRKELWAEDSPEAPRVKVVLKLFDDARLIVTDTNVAGEPYLELAHDTLILGWARLLDWVRADAPRIAALRRLTADATQWEHSAREVKALLWSDAARSVAAQDLLAAEYPGLNESEKKFALESVSRSKRNRRLRMGALVGFSLLAMIAALVATLYGIGVQQAEMDRLLSSARSFQNVGDSTRAYAFALAALEKSSNWPLLWGDRRTTAESVLNSLMNEGVPRVYAQFSATSGVSLSDKGTFIAAIGRVNGSDRSGRNTLILGTLDRLESRVAAGHFLVGTFRPGRDEYYAASFQDNHIVIEAFAPGSGKPVRRFPMLEFRAPQDFDRDGDRPEDSFTLNPRMVDDVAFSADGKTLIVAGWAAPDSMGVLKRPWRAYVNAESGVVEQYASPDQQVDLPPAVHRQRIVASEDGSRIASAGFTEIYMDSPGRSKRVVVGSYTRGPLIDVAISPSGKQIVAGGSSGDLTLFREAPDGGWSSSEFALPGDEDVELLRFVSEQVIVASRSDYTLTVARLHDEKGADPMDTRTLRGHSASIRSLIVDRSGNRVFSAGEDLEVRIWGLETGERRVLRGSGRAVSGLVLSSSSDWLFSWDIGGKILAWHLPDGISPAYTHKFPGKEFEEPIQTESYLGAGDAGTLRAYVNRMSSHMIRRLDIAQAGRLVVAGYYGGPIVLWDRDSGAVQILNEREDDFRFFGNGEYLAVGEQVMKASDRFARVYTTSVPAILNGDKWVTIEKGVPAFHPLVEGSALKGMEIENHLGDDEIRHFSPDGQWLVSLAKRRYCFWKSPFQSKGRCGRAPSPWSFTKGDAIFSPGGDRILIVASGTDGKRLVEIDLAREQATVLSSGELAYTFAVSADGSLIAAAGRFGELYFGRADAFQLREIGRHSRQILSIAFSPDGRWIATGGLDRMVRIWSTSTFDNTRYDFLNPVESIIFDERYHRWLVASGGSVFSISALESDMSQLVSRSRKVSNVRVDPDNIGATVLQPVESALFQ